MSQVRESALDAAAIITAALAGNTSLPPAAIVKIPDYFNAIFQATLTAAEKIESQQPDDG